MAITHERKNTPNGDLVCLGFPFTQVPTSIFLAWSLTAGSPSKTMCEVLSLVSQRIGILRLVNRMFMDTSVFLRCYYAFVLPILEYCSPVWGTAAECHFQLLERQVYSVARLFPDQTFLSWCHRCHVATLCMLYKVNSNSNHCMFSELPSASVRVRRIRAATAAHPLEFEVSRCRKNVPICKVFPTCSDSIEDWPSTGTLDGFKEQSIVGILPEFFFLSFSWFRCLWGCEKNF